VTSRIILAQEIADGALGGSEHARLAQECFSRGFASDGRATLAETLRLQRGKNFRVSVRDAHLMAAADLLGRVDDWARARSLMGELAVFSRKVDSWTRHGVPGDAKPVERLLFAAWNAADPPGLLGLYRATARNRETAQLVRLEDEASQIDP